MAVEKTISQRRVYDGRILNVRVDEAVLPNGKTVTREVIEHHGACGIVAFDEDGKLLMVRQYRYPMACELLELPAGKIDPGETPDACAARELEEETGYRASKLEFLGDIYPIAAYCCEVVHLYLAKGLTRGRSTSTRMNSSMCCMSISTRRSAGFSPGSCPTPRPRSES